MNGFGAGMPIIVNAEHNYWSDSPYFTLGERFGNLIVYYEPFWSMPCGYEENSEVGLLMTSMSGDIVDTLYSLQKTVDTLSNTTLLYSDADKKILSAEFDDAELIYNQIIDSDDSLSAKVSAYLKLYNIGKLDGRSSSYFDNLYNYFSTICESTEDSLMGKIFSQLGLLSLIGNQEYIPAIEQFDEIVQNNSGTEQAIYAEIDALTAALLLEESDSTLGKSAAGNYIVNDIEYGNRVMNLLKMNFGAENAEQEEVFAPTEYTLYQNYPNPFNPITTIQYDLLVAGNVELVVFDILGRKVSTLVNQNQDAGRYKVHWDASGMASGVYIYSIKSGDFTASKKLLLLK